MAKKKKHAKDFTPRIDNRKARHEYQVIDTLECGIVLTGSEVKSVREGRVMIAEGFAEVDRNDELILWNVHIDLYSKGGSNQHIPGARRKLLAHRKQIAKLKSQARVKGITMVPLDFHFNEAGRIKVLLGVVQGKKSHDKRASEKQRDAKRQIDRAMTRKVLR